MNQYFGFQGNKVTVLVMLCACTLLNGVSGVIYPGSLCLIFGFADLQCVGDDE